MDATLPVPLASVYHYTFLATLLDWFAFPFFTLLGAVLAWTRRGGTTTFRVRHPGVCRAMLLRQCFGLLSVFGE